MEERYRNEEGMKENDQNVQVIIERYRNERIKSTSPIDQRNPQFDSKKKEELREKFSTIKGKYLHILNQALEQEGHEILKSPSSNGNRDDLKL